MRDLLFFESAKSGRPAYLVSRIDGKRGNDEICDRARDNELLGASFIAAVETPSTQECPIPEERDGKIVKQRNELRFLNPANYHAADQPHWYSISFRLEGADGDEIPDCGSVRWVNAQWKYTRYEHETDPSPFLAQRFDNGVLHVTVEDGPCRCMIAKAEGGDPDKMVLAKMVPGKLNRVEPLRCYGPTDCPPRLRLWAAGKAIPSLPDPKTRWVRMTYRVQADGKTGTSFDVYANGEFIVRAEGAISDGANIANEIKFKFGHYRDKIPIRAHMLVNDVCLSEKAADCDKSISPVP